MVSLRNNFTTKVTQASGTHELTAHQIFGTRRVPRMNEGGLRMTGQLRFGSNFNRRAQGRVLVVRIEEFVAKITATADFAGAQGDRGVEEFVHCERKKHDCSIHAVYCIRANVRSCSETHE